MNDKRAVADMQSDSGARTMYGNGSSPSLSGRFGAWVKSKLAGGLFGALFIRPHSSLIGTGRETISDTTDGKRMRDGLSHIRHTVSSYIEASVTSGITSRIIRWFINLRLKSIGIVILVTALYNIAFGAILSFAENRFGFDTSYLVPAAFIILSLPLLLSSLTLSKALCTSQIGRLMLTVADTASSELPVSHPSGRTNLAFVTGIILGIISYFTGVVGVFTAILCVVALFVVLCNPEAGVILTLAIFPFVGIYHVTSVIGVTAAGFILKLIRGKRYASFKKADISVFTFGIFILLGGTFTSGSGNFRHTLSYFILLISFFIIVSFIRSLEMISKCQIVLVISATAYMFIFDVSFLLAELTGLPLNKSEVLTASGLSSDHVLGAYLALMIPVVLSMLLSRDARIGKGVLLFSLGLMLIAAGIVRIAALFLAAAVGAAILLFIRNPATLAPILMTAISTVTALWAAPDAVQTKIVYYSEKLVSNFEIKSGIWRTSMNILRDNFFAGIGIGSWSHVYPKYAAGATVSDSQSVFIQLWIETGLAGLLMFVFIILVLTAELCTYFSKLNSARSTVAYRIYSPLSRRFSGAFPEPTDKSGKVLPLQRLGVRCCTTMRLMAAGPFCGILTALLYGLGNNIFSNRMIFLLFWALAALVICSARTGTEEAVLSAETYIDGTDRSSAAEISIMLKKSKQANAKNTVENGGQTDDGEKASV